MNIKKLICAVLPLLVTSLLCSQSSAQVELTIQNRGDLFQLDFAIEATGITTVAGNEVRFVSDSQGEGFFPRGNGQFLSGSNQISLGGVQLLNVSFTSTGTQNTIVFDFNGPVPTGTDLSDLNGDYRLFICTSCERSFEPGAYQVAFESGIDFGDVVLNVLPFIAGDVSGDGAVNFLDISPFIAVLTSGDFQGEADTDRNGVVNFLDIASFIALLSGSGE